MLATSDATIFGLVVFLVVAVAVVVAVATGLRGRDAYERIGGTGPVGERPPGADAAERDEEIRQLEQARRRRRELRAAAGVAERPDGPAPAAVDPELAEELRQLAQARNVRRARAGLEPLDVEAEVARRMPDG
jgi:hypothetical protein